MQYLFMADLMSNFIALESAYIQAQSKWGSDFKLLIVGNIFGYCMQPVECIEFLLENKAIIIGGRNEFALKDKGFPLSGSVCYRKMIDHTNDALRKAGLLSEIDRFITEYTNESLTVSFSLFDNNGIELCVRPDFLTSFSHLNSSEATSKTLTVVNGNGFSWFYQDSDSGKIVDNLNFTLDPANKKTVIGLGSIGMPKDENPMSSILFFGKSFEFVRFSYPINLVQDNMKKFNFIDKSIIDRMPLGI